MKLAAEWWYWQRHDSDAKRPAAVLPFHLVDLAAYVEDVERRLADYKAGRL
jgi:hypothetical protein